MAATVDAHYNRIREQLYVLGFDQPLPLGAVALVGRMLDDLVQTTAALQRTEAANAQLMQVRAYFFLRDVHLQKNYTEGVAG